MLRYMQHLPSHFQAQNGFLIQFHSGNRFETYFKSCCLLFPFRILCRITECSMKFRVHMYFCYKRLSKLFLLFWILYRFWILNNKTMTCYYEKLYYNNNSFKCIILGFYPSYYLDLHHVPYLLGYIQTRAYYSSA